LAPAALLALSSLPWVAGYLAAPAEAAYSAADRLQYVAGTYSGYGLPQVIDAVERDAAGKPAILLIQPKYNGLPQDYLLYRWQGHPTLRVYTEDVQQGSRERLATWATHRVPIYILLNRDEDNPAVMAQVEARWHDAALVARVEKPGGRSAFAAYRLPGFGT
jgi:hypothetical protein